MKSISEVEQIKSMCNGVSALVSAVFDREFTWEYVDKEECIYFNDVDYDNTYTVNVNMSSVEACLRDIARQFLSVVGVE